MQQLSAREKKKTTTETVAISRLLRLHQVLEIVPVHRATWWRWVREGRAPKAVHIGCATFWREADVRRFVESI